MDDLISKHFHVYIHFYNGNYDTYENVHELTFIGGIVKIVVENEDGVLFADHYTEQIIKMIRIVQDPKEN